MNCNCNTMYCSSATTDEDSVKLVPNMNVKTLINTETYGLIICTGAAASANRPVFITTSIGDIPVLCKAGNTVYANQLKTRMRYTVMYGDENENYTDGQFVIQNCIDPRSAITESEMSI